MNLKVLGAFIRKEFKHIFRDYRTLVVLFGLPLIQIVLFGYAITTDLRDVPIAIWDKSKDDASISLINSISSSGFYVPAVEVSSPGELESGFKKGSVKAAVVIGSDFNSNLSKKKASVQVITDAADPNTANIVSNQLSGIIARWAGEQVGGSKAIPGIVSKVRMHYNPDLASVNLFVPGVITVILMLICATLTSIAIAREKEMGNMEILLVSPLKPMTVILGKILPYLVLSLVIALFALGLGFFVFQVPVKGSLVLLFFESLLFIVVALSLGVLISIKAKSQQMALMLSLFALMMPTIILSGFIFPISSMPLPLQWLSALMPPRYFIVIIKAIMLKGVGLASIWKESLVLLVMAVFLIVVSVKNYKNRLT